MTQVLVRMLDNGRIAARGANRRENGVALSLDPDETIPVSVDWTQWLGSDTISSVANSATGVTVSGASNTTTAAGFSLSGATCGYVEHRVTTAAGAVKELLIAINGPSWPKDYE